MKNKGAFSKHIEELQKQIDDENETPEFAIGVFDCDSLKIVNDDYGHYKGDIYLKSACQLICKVFDHSPVFRIGGDEFAAVLQKHDFDNMDKLISTFEERRKQVCDTVENKWEEVHIAMGVAVYDPQHDGAVSDTVRRADKIMYENKRLDKAKG